MLDWLQPLKKVLYPQYECRIRVFNVAAQCSTVWTRAYKWLHTYVPTPLCSDCSTYVPTAQPMFRHPYVPTAQPMFRHPYVPTAQPMFRYPYVPTPLCSDCSIYVPTPLCSDTPMFRILNLCSDTPMFRLLNLCSDTPMFRHPYVPTAQPMFRHPYVSTPLQRYVPTPYMWDWVTNPQYFVYHITPMFRLLNLCSDTPMFRLLNLCSDTPMCRHPYVPTPLYKGMFRHHTCGIEWPIHNMLFIISHSPVVNVG